MHVGALLIGSCPWHLRPFFWNERRRYGRVPDAALLWARSPRLFLGSATLYRMIDRRRSPIEPALRSLTTVRVAQINWCTFCIDLNSATLLKRDASKGKIAALSAWRSSALFSERERVALDYAEAMTRRDIRDGLFEQLRAPVDDIAIAELTGLIAFPIMSNNFNSALAVPPQGFCYLRSRSTRPSHRPCGSRRRVDHWHAGEAQEIGTDAHSGSRGTERNIMERR